jgi:hypothetical protein
MEVDIRRVVLEDVGDVMIEHVWSKREVSS